MPALVHHVISFFYLALYEKFADMPWHPSPEALAFRANLRRRDNVVDT